MSQANEKKSDLGEGDTALISIEEALTMPAGDLALRSAVEFYHLKLDVAEVLAAARDCANHIDRALALKYADTAHECRLRVGKDSGVIHLNDDRVRITADLPKQVEWDQKKLAEVVERIRASGEDASEFVEIQYRVDERKYNAWPHSLQAAFAPARTFKTGKPAFRLALMSEGGAP